MITYCGKPVDEQTIISLAEENEKLRQEICDIQCKYVRDLAAMARQITQPETGLFGKIFG